MAEAAGEGKELPLRVAFDRRIKLEIDGARITSDGGLLAYRELDDTFGLTTIAALRLAEVGVARTFATGCLACCARPVYGSLAGYEDVNEAERLARDPAMRAIVGREGAAGRRPQPARWAASRPSGWQARSISQRSRTCPAPGSTGCMGGGRRMASSSTWTARRVRPTGSRKALARLAGSDLARCHGRE